MNKTKTIKIEYDYVKGGYITFEELLKYAVLVENPDLVEQVLKWTNKITARAKKEYKRIK